MSIDTIDFSFPQEIPFTKVYFGCIIILNAYETTKIRETKADYFVRIEGFITL